jgi:hypothetical protein
MPEVNKTERKATKFVSAEEEAAIRKGELAALKAQKDAALIAAEAIPVSTISIEIVDGDTKLSLAEGASSLHLEAVTDISPRTDDSKSPVPDDTLVSDLSTKPSVLRRRQSILDSSNPDMLNTLNKMMSPSEGGGSPMRGAVRTFPKSSKIVPKETDTTIEVKEKEVKVSKSKLLQASNVHSYLFNHVSKPVMIIIF